MKKISLLIILLLFVFVLLGCNDTGNLNRYGIKEKDDQSLVYLPITDQIYVIKEGYKVEFKLNFIKKI